MQSTQSHSRRRAQTARFATPPPADIPLPMSVESSRPMTTLYDVTESSDAHVWSPFEEPRFAIVAFPVLRGSPQMLAERLRLQGITRNFWKELGLPDATGPPRDQDPYTESELSELFAAIADRAKVSSSLDPRSFCDASPQDCRSGEVTSLQAPNKFNSPISPLSLGFPSRDRQVSQSEADLPKSASTSPQSIFSSRRSSLGNPATLVDSRQPSSHGLAPNRQPTPEMAQSSRLASTPMQVRHPLHSLKAPDFEIRSFRAHQPSDSSSQRMQEEGEVFTEAEHFTEVASLQTRPFAQPADIAQTKALPSLLMHVRKHSSSESQNTIETVSSTVQSSPMSSSAVNRSSSVGSEVRLNVEHQPPLFGGDMGTFLPGRSPATSVDGGDSLETQRYPTSAST